MRSVQQEIQTQLERLGLASTESDYGQGGGLDVDFDFESSDNVKICDSQECTVFDAFQLLPALEALEAADWDQFWEIANPLMVN